MSAGWVGVTHDRLRDSCEQKGCGGTSPVVSDEDSVLPLHRAQVQSLIRGTKILHATPMRPKKKIRGCGARRPL